MQKQTNVGLSLLILVGNLIFNPFLTIYNYVTKGKENEETRKVMERMLWGSLIGAVVGAAIFFTLLYFTSVFNPIILAGMTGTGVLAALVGVGYGIACATSILFKSAVFSIWKSHVKKVTPLLAEGIDRLPNSLAASLVSNRESMLAMRVVWNFFFNPLATFFTLYSAPRNPINQAAFAGSAIGVIIGTGIFIILFVVPGVIAGTATLVTTAIGYGIIWSLSTLFKGIGIAIWDNTESGKKLHRQLEESEMPSLSIFGSAFLGSSYTPLLFANSKNVDSIPQEIGSVSGLAVERSDIVDAGKYEQEENSTNPSVTELSEELEEEEHSDDDAETKIKGTFHNVLSTHVGGETQQKERYVTPPLLQPISSTSSPTALLGGEKWGNFSIPPVADKPISASTTSSDSDSEDKEDHLHSSSSR